MEYYAHTVKNGQNEPLMDHLRKTADLAEKYAAEFHSGKVGRQLGLLHDTGKRTRKFQDVLRGRETRIDHAVVGAELYVDEDNKKRLFQGEDDFLYYLICNAIAGHHSSLDGPFRPEDIDWDNFYTLPKDFSSREKLLVRDQKVNALSSIEEYQEIAKYAETNQLLLTITDEDALDTAEMDDAAAMLYARMLFSCLVDADYTATGMLDDPELTETTADRAVQPDSMLTQLKEYRDNILAGSDPENSINQLRNLVYHDAAEAGTGPVSLYTLNAPTGTAKTLALIKFALEQAKTHQLKQIIIVLPYLSIISQNAEVYRQIFGAENVMEDDSQTEFTDEARIYADRWNSPITVTTSVKFFETLFASKASTLRKLHRLANSVIVFDESQTLPNNLTDVTMETLRALTEYFNTTVLLSTATQPSYHWRRALSDWNAREIIHDPNQLFQRYEIAKKTEVCFDTENEWTPDELAEYFSDSTECVYVFNTTKKAERMYAALRALHSEEDVFLLTSRFCAEHKLEIVQEINQRLKSEEPCYLAATQCIEAGVDLDFPSGAREYAPFSSIVQAAGRVNRNGKRSGKMLVFTADLHGKYDFPDTNYQNEANTSYSLAEREGHLSLNSLNDIDHYYKLLFHGDAQEGRDRDEITEVLNRRDIATMAKMYQLIDGQEQITVLVPYNGCHDDYMDFMKRVQANGYHIQKKDMRMCRKFSVSLYGRGNTLDFVRNHCHQLLIRSPFGDVPVNWYIADIDPIYSKKAGLMLQNKEDEEGGLFV